MVEPFDGRGLHYEIHSIMVDVALFQEFLHIRVKFLFSVSLQIFRASSIVIGFERHGLCMLIQHIDKDKNVMVTFVEYVCKGVFRPYQPTTDYRIRKL